MNPDLDTLATRLYVTIDDLLIDHPEWAPERPAVGIAPKLTDAELLTLAVVQALLGFTSEARFIRHAHANLPLGSRTYPTGLATTSGSATPASCSSTSLDTSPGPARHGTTTCGSST